MNDKESSFESVFINWAVRFLALGFFGLFFAAGCMAVYVGINDPLNLKDNADLGIYGAAPFGLLFMTMGILPIYYVFKPVVIWENYLEPVD